MGLEQSPRLARRRNFVDAVNFSEGSVPRKTHNISNGAVISDRLQILTPMLGTTIPSGMRNWRGSFSRTLRHKCGIDSGGKDGWAPFLMEELLRSFPMVKEKLYFVKVKAVRA